MRFREHVGSDRGDVTLPTAYVPLNRTVEAAGVAAQTIWQRVQFTCPKMQFRERFLDADRSLRERCAAAAVHHQRGSPDPDNAKATAALGE